MEPLREVLFLLNSGALDWAHEGLFRERVLSLSPLPRGPSSRLYALCRSLHPEPRGLARLFFTLAGVLADCLAEEPR